MDGGLLHPILADHAATAPNAALQEKLAELDEIPRPQIQPAAHVTLPGGRQVDVIPVKLQRVGDVLAKQIR